MKYPTEYKETNVTNEWKDNLQKKYYYTNDGVIYKISAYNDGSCKDVRTWDELKENDVKITLTYTKNNENEVKTYLLLDYLIQVGDKIDSNGNITIHYWDGKSGSETSDEKLTYRFKQLQIDEIITKIINGNSLNSVVNNLPPYFKGNNYKVTCGLYTDYVLTGTSSLTTGLFKIENEDGNEVITAQEALAGQIKVKAETECKILAQSIMDSVNKNVTSVSIGIKEE